MPARIQTAFEFPEPSETFAVLALDRGYINTAVDWARQAARIHAAVADAVVSYDAALSADRARAAEECVAWAEHALAPVDDDER